MESSSRMRLNAPFTLVTTSVTANQQIGSYTVVHDNAHLITIIIEAYLSALNTTAVYLGTITLQINGFTWLGPFEATNTSSGALFGIVIPLPKDYDIENGDEITAVCTPTAATSTTWIVSLIGWETENKKPPAKTQKRK